MPNRPLSVAEAARRIGLSRMQVIRKIKSGEISAQRVGRSYVIPEDGLPGIYRKITPSDKSQVERAVKRVLQEYGDAIRRLGREW
ncbi:MAG: excisionase family DNA-binding protein [Deltaproteobacteria bacterium]|nr:excisionase family DNA-binding protein [Deltaproteobacteria bacterium]MBI4374417.1 excisionase family DNA-binding protein [Deltaproteobacteria bacterium]